MNRQDPIFELVERLSTSEKRYISTNAPADKIFINLYKDLTKMSFYDKEKLEREYGNNLSAYKHKLYHFILQNLRDYRRNKDVQIQITDYLTDARILLERDLIEQCIERVEKAKALAIEIDDYLAIQSAVKLERYCFLKSKRMRDEIPYASIFASKEQSLQNLLEEIAMEDLYYDLYQNTHLVLNEEEQMNLMERYPPARFDLEHAPGNFRARRRFLEAALLYFNALKNLEKATEYALLTLDWWNQHESRKESDAHSYLLSLSNTISFLIYAGKTDQAEKLYREMGKLKTQNEHTLGIAFHKSAIGRLMLYINARQMDKAKKLADQVKQDKRLNAIPFPSKFSLNYNIAVFYFVMEDFKNCALWTKEILQLIPSETRQDVQIAALFLQLIMECEKDQPDQILNKTKAFRMANKFFNKHLQLDPDNLANIALRFFSGFEAVPILERKAYFQKFLNTLQKINSSRSTAVFLTGLDELIIWSISKLKNISLLEALGIR